MYLGNFNTGATVYVGFNTVDKTNGAPITLAGTPVAKVYKGNSTTTEVTTGVTLTVDHDSLTGHHVITVDTSADGTFYATGSDFRIVLTAGTVDGVSVVGTIVGSFSLEARAAKVSGYSSGFSPTLPVRSGTAQAGAASSITLDAGASAVTDFYVRDVVYITGGTGAGQARAVTAYNGTTKVATVANAWATNPDVTSTFSVLPAATVTLAPAQSITSFVINNPAGHALSLTSGSGVGHGIDISGGVNGVNVVARQYGMYVEGNTADNSYASMLITQSQLLTNGGPGLAIQTTSSAYAGYSIVNTHAAGTGCFISGGARDLDSNVFGNITGNLIGSITGSVGSIGSGVTVTTNNDKTGYTATVSDKTGFKLASDGLNAIDVTAPTTVAATFPAMVVALFRRFYAKVTKTSTQVRTYAADGTTVVTTQIVSDDGTTQTQGPAA